MVTHLLPISAFGSPSGVDVRPFERNPSPLVSIIGGFDHTRFNADGFIAWSERSYVQVFRSGCLEAVYVFPGEYKTQGGGSYFPSRDFESRLFGQIGHAKKLLQSMSVECPIAVLVSLVHVKGWRMGLPPGYSSSPLDIFDRDPLLIPEIIVEGFNQQTFNEARPLIDAIWNAAGWPGSPHYDMQGKWDPRQWAGVR
jgi:hypothetical protein